MNRTGAQILVTGARGFIGSNLMKKLNGASMLFHHDIVHGHSYNAEKLFFLSTYGNMAWHKDWYGMIIQANVQDLLNVLDGFTGWFCYMSSSSVTLPVQTPYSRTKRAAEEILQALPHLKTCIVRPYSVTGVGEQKEHLIPTLIRSCMEGEAMPFDPYPEHDFVDVSDVVNVIVQLSELKSTGIFEIGNGYGYSNREVRELVEKVCGRKANVTSQRCFREYDSSEWHASAPTISNPKSLLTSIEEMVYEHTKEKRD